MSANIAVIYSGALDDVAQAFSEAAGHLAAQVRLLQVGGNERARAAVALRLTPALPISSGQTGSRSARRQGMANLLGR